MKYYLIGRNIESSLSPRIHNYLFKLKDRPQSYQPPIQSRTFSLREMQDRSFGGTSITIPYKTHYNGELGLQKDGILSSKHGISNTIYKSPNNKLIATNTDIFGIQQCFYGKIQQIEHRNALIIGAGATAQTYCSFFETQKFKASFINRSHMKQSLKSRFNNVLDFLPLKPSPVDLKNCPIYSIVVNTLPSQVVRQHWQHLQLNLLNLLRNYPRASAIKMIYMNVNYREKLDPLQELLKNRLNLRVQTLKGLDMLLWQALEQNRLFCNQQKLHLQDHQWHYGKLRQQLGLH